MGLDVGLSRSLSSCGCCMPASGRTVRRESGKAPVFLTVWYNVCSQSKMLPAARLVTGTRRSDHITPVLVLRQLHWLPVRQSVISRLPAVFSRHWPTNHPPTSPTTAAWYQTRTVADSALLTLELASSPNVYAIGDGSFSAAAPRVWNGLPSALRAQDLTFDRFKRRVRLICLHLSA